MGKRHIQRHKDAKNTKKLERESAAENFMIRGKQAKASRQVCNVPSTTYGIPPTNQYIFQEEADLSPKGRLVNLDFQHFTVFISF